MPTREETLRKDGQRTYIWCRQQDAARLTGVPLKTMVYWHLRYGMPPVQGPGKKRVYRKADLVRLAVARGLLAGGERADGGMLAVQAACAIVPEGMSTGEVLLLGENVEYAPVGGVLNRYDNPQRSWGRQPPDVAAAWVQVSLGVVVDRLVARALELRGEVDGRGRPVLAEAVRELSEEEWYRLE